MYLYIYLPILMRLFEFDKKGRNVERVKNVPNYDLYHEVNIILPEIKFL